MTKPTEAQAAYIRSLANRILAKSISTKPTFHKSWNGRKVSSNEVIEEGHRIAGEALEGLEAGAFGIDGRVTASQIIDGLKIAARRAGC